MLSVVMVLGIVACKTSKKSTSTAATNSSNPPAAQTNTNAVVGPVGPLIPVKSKDGVNPPGDEELTAIKGQFPGITMVKLNEGHELYTNTACVSCHNAKSIYRRDVAEWKDIIDDMSVRAKLNTSEKEAVYAYVLAMKATQPK
jgi:cytochrome c1